MNRQKEALLSGQYSCFVPKDPGFEFRQTNYLTFLRFTVVFLNLSNGIMEMIGNTLKPS
jgi:hypothetical protein